MLHALPVTAAAPAFAGGPELASDTGHVLLGWDADEPVTLSIAGSADFSDARPVYRGSGRSYFLSGLATGDYYLRLEGESGAVSPPVRLKVVHQSLERALWLTLIGLVITLAIIGTILRGARHD
jgi:hypothetical protein